MTTRAAIAHKMHAEIIANVSAYYSDTIDHSTFSARNRAIWDRSSMFGVNDAVSALIRGDAADFARITA